MKSKILYFSILLITCVFASCGLIRREDIDEPTTQYYTLTISAGEGGTVNSDVNGSYKAGTQVTITARAYDGWTFSKWSDGNTNSSRTITMDKDYKLTASFQKSSEPTEEKYYIKHPWGDGADSSWSWKQMTKVGSNYEYEGLWGGVGANINTKASDSGAEWFNESMIDGASTLYVGDGVRFTYNPSSQTLSATKTSSGGGSSEGTAKVRFVKEITSEKLTKMSIEYFNDDSTWVETLAEYDFDANSGTTSYYDIKSCKAVPMIYYIGETEEKSGWLYVFDDFFYNFIAGKKYSYICREDDGDLTFIITVDGTFNAPAKSHIVAQKRIKKSDIIKSHFINH